MGKIAGISIDRVSGWVYSRGMEKQHEVVNKILDYLDTRRTELSNEMASISFSPDYIVLDAMYEVYDHLIAKLEDDFR